MSILIGTSGWHYRHWVGAYYPPKTPAERFLAHYQQDFPTVEINNTFYRLPSAETFAEWRDTVPPDFRFAVKAGRLIIPVYAYFNNDIGGCAPRNAKTLMGFLRD